MSAINQPKHADHPHDAASEILLYNTTEVLRAFMECSDEVRKGILEMIEIIRGDDADEDEKAAAADTLLEALYPQYVDGELGIDSLDYEDQSRKIEASIENSLDEEERVFAANLLRIMEEKKISQTDLAEKIGVGQSAVANMLARQCRPQRRTVEKVSRALGVKPSALWPAAREQGVSARKKSVDSRR